MHETILDFSEASDIDRVGPVLGFKYWMSETLCDCALNRPPYLH